MCWLATGDQSPGLGERQTGFDARTEFGKREREREVETEGGRNDRESGFLKVVRVLSGCLMLRLGLGEGPSSASWQEPRIITAIIIKPIRDEVEQKQELEEGGEPRPSQPTRRGRSGLRRRGRVEGESEDRLLKV